jgi:tRNA(Ser,Leu) C12 N-acetylase TAN1
MFQFNLLVTYSYDFLGARREIRKALKSLGDDSALVRRTLVKGIIGVVTSLDSHEIATNLRKLAVEDPHDFYYTQRWIPIDIWTSSDIPNMKEGVKKAAKIGTNERWMMVVEKRRYETHHTAEIIRDLAEGIEGLVDLKNPEKILRIDILGPYAGISQLRPEDIFSSVRFPSE